MVINQISFSNKRWSLLLLKHIWDNSEYESLANYYKYCHIGRTNSGADSHRKAKAQFSCLFFFFQSSFAYLAFCKSHFDLLTYYKGQQI